LVEAIEKKQEARAQQLSDGADDEQGVNQNTESAEEAETAAAAAGGAAGGNGDSASETTTTQNSVSCDAMAYLVLMLISGMLGAVSGLAVLDV